MVRKIRGLILTVVLVWLGFFWSSLEIKANESRICKLGSSCIVGEFLFDDTYAPINSNATCTLTTRNPTGNIWLDGVTLSIGNSDGWYSYNVDTSGHDEGYYPSQVCCTIGTGTTEYMCLDKSFQLETAGLTSLGTLPDNISAINSTINTINSNVNAISNSVNSVGTSVNVILEKWGTYSASDILSSVNSVTSGLGTNSDSCSVNSVFGNIACIRDKWGTQTAQALYNIANSALSVGNSLRAELNYNGKSTNAYDDLQTIKNYVDTLETSIGNSGDLSSTSLFGKILGVQTSLASSTTDIRADIGNVKTVVDSINGKVDTISTNINSLITKWGAYSASDIISNVTTVQSRLGTTTDTCSNNTVFGNIACVKDKWGSQSAQVLFDAANGALNVGTSLRAELNYNGKSTTAYADLQSLKNYVDTLETSIGGDDDLSSAATLFGKIKGNQEGVVNIRADIAAIKTVVDSINGKVDTISGNVTLLLSKWGSYSISDILSSINGVNSGIGSNTDTCSDNTVFGNIACIRDKWGSQTAQVLYDATNNVLNIGSSLRAELNYNGKSTTAYEDLQSIKAYVDSLETNIGNSSDSSSVASLFGKIKGNEEGIANVPTNVWGYTQRTLTNFGTLVSDIWSYTSRSLTNFGTLIANIWSNPTRTLSSNTLDSGELATQGDIAGLGSSLTTDISNIKSVVDAINGKVDTISTNVNTLVTKWGIYSASDILTNVGSISTNIGVNTDICGTSTVFGNIACVRDKWGTQTAQALYDTANDAKNTINNLRSEMAFNGKSTTAYEDIQTIKSYVDGLETSIGNSSDLSSTGTLFGKVKSNKEDIAIVKTSIDSIETKVNTLDTKVGTINTTVNSLLAKWGAYSVSDLLTSINSINAGIGSSGDICTSNTIFGNIACIRDKWGTQTAQTLYEAASGALNIGTSLRAELNYNGKSTTAYEDLQSIKAYVDSLETNIGNSSDLSSSATIFGKVKANKENIETVSGQVAGVQSSVDSISTKIDSLQIAVDGLNTKINSILDKWGSYSIADVLNNIGGISSVLGVETDTCAGSESIYGSIACIKDKWGTRTADDLYTTADNALTTISALRTELNYNGKSTTAYADVQSIKTNVSSLQSMIGNSDDVATTETIFGRIKKVQSSVEALDETGIGVEELLDKWGTLSAADIYDKVKNLTSEISAVNTVTNVSSILSLNQASSTDIVALKNQLLSIKALVEINKDLVEKVVDKPVVKTWLEEGSIIFKTMVTNPSSKRQTATVKFYLPKEAREKDIMKIDSGVSVNYDSEKEALYVSGDFNLAAKETKIVSVEINDIWKIAETEIESLKVQSEELSKPLEKTAYFAQGVTLKSDINILLESISRTQKEAVTPEAKIQAYRENVSKLNSVKSEVKELKSLVSSLSSNNTMTGFIGGAQTFSLWGMAIIIVINVVAITLYFRTIMKKTSEGTKHIGYLIKDKRFQKRVGVVTMFFFIWVGVIGTTYQGVNTIYKAKKATKVIEKVEEIKKTTEIAMVTQKVEDQKILGVETKEQIKVSPPKDSNVSLKIRNAPDLSAEIVGKIWATRTVDKYMESDGWIKVGTTLTIDGKEEYVSGWVRSEYTIK